MIGTGTTDPTGSFSVSLTTPQKDTQKLTVNALDAANNKSPDAIVTALDLTPPAAPTNLAVVQEGSVVTGKAEPNSKIVIKDPAGNVIGTGTTDPTGSFSVSLTTPQKDTQKLTVNALDAANNKSPDATVKALDLTPPAAPTDLAVTNAGGTVTGKAEPNSKIMITDPAGNVIGTGVTNGNGQFDVSLNSAQINSESLSVQAVDASNNKSPNAKVQAPDLTAPDLGTSVFNGTGTQVSGTAEANSKITVKDVTGKVIGTGIAGSDGKFVVNLDKAYGNGEKVNISAADLAGNMSLPKAATAPILLQAKSNVVHADIDLGYTTTTSSYSESKGFGSIVKFLGISIFGKPTAEINFNVGDTQATSVDIRSTNTGLATLIDSTRVTLYKEGANGVWEKVVSSTDTGLFDAFFFFFFPEQARLKTVDTLAQGNYKIIAEDLSLFSFISLNSLNVTYNTTNKSSLLEAQKVNTVSGNVLIDDVTTAGTLVSKIVNSDGKSVDVSSIGTGSTLIGKFGTLVIKADGSYSYTPAKDANNIGKVDTFTYTIKNANGNSSEAKVYVQIGSDEVSVQWDAADPSKQGKLLKLFDDQDTVSLNVYKSTQTSSSAVNSGELVAYYKKASVVTSDTFTIGTDKIDSSIKVAVKAGYDKGYSGTQYTAYQDADDTTFNWQLQKYNNVTKAWEDVAGAAGSKYFNSYTSSIKTGTELFNADINNITQPGDYRVNFKADTGTGGWFSNQEFATNVTITSKAATDNWYQESYGKTSGNIFTGVSVETASIDKLGLGNKLSISTDGGVTFKDVTTAGITVQGQSGSLIIKADGSYDYTQTASSVTSENFIYKVTTNAGEVATAKLAIAFESFVHGTTGTDTFTSDSLLHVLTLGAGADTVKFTAFNSYEAHPDIWTDFSKAEGDKINVSSLLSGHGVNSSNISQYVTIQQSGKDAVVKIDLDGSGTQYTAKNLVILENTTTSLDELLKGNNIVF